MKTISKMIVSAFVPALFFLAGCINIDYQGESLEPLASDAKVNFYFAREQMPKVPSRKLGIVTAKADSTYSAPEIEAKLRKYAREKGANCVLITKIERRPTGMARPDQIGNQTSVSWTPDDSSSTAYQYFRNGMTNYDQKSSDERMSYALTVKAEFLKMDLPAKKAAVK